MTTATRRYAGVGRAPEPAPTRGYRRRRWPWVLSIGLVLALLAGGAYVFWKTPMFAVRGISISSSDGKPLPGALTAAVKTATKGQIGTPLVSVDLGAVQADVAAVPQVKSVTAAREWPNILSLTITARVAVAVTNANGAWWSLDADGLPYVSSKTRPASLPAIELATPGPHDPATRAALDVVKALPKPVRAMVSRIRAPSAYQVTLVLNDDRTVIWGDGSNTAQKAQILPVVLEQPGTVFDLTDPTMVTVK
ncbi:cell division protein FtsQ/DivIB [Nakamurella lactea]|uniref:cell division protein FtsQ/DivIB n=1 Tax=Nakamurella lactea TaxID=459515 RepID=UPI00040F4D78|nr:FtsQ-type POTRA domain-containing protein [Nakamurella lactea]